MVKPNIQGEGAHKALEKADAQFKQFSESIENATLDHLNKKPASETEPQLKKSNRELHQMEAIHLKPTRTISSKEPFNENFRAQWKEANERVLFVAENNEVKGETLHFWTKPFPGEAACEWKVPVGKPVNGPRHVAEKISRCLYHRLRTDDSVVTENGTNMQFYGGIVVDETINRLNARPVGSPFLSMAS